MAALRTATYALGVAVACAASVVSSRASEAFHTVERPESDLLLLAVRVGQIDLDLTLPSYPGKGDTLVPLGALAQGLDIAIQVDANGGVAQGFVLDERRRFRLAADTVWVDGAPRRFDPAGVEWHHEDVYVGAKLLAEWLPLDLTIDPRASTLVVLPHEPLPIQRRLERERAYRRARIGSHPEVAGDRLEPAYRPWGWPVSDHTLYAYQRSAPFEHRRGLQYSTSVTGDLLYLETHGFLAGDDQEPTRDLRLSMGRRDPDATLLGPLGAREIVAGDVLDPGLELVGLTSAGKGALLSSFPLYDETEYDRRAFRGDLLPGWDVELYLNDALIGYRQSGAGSTYEFADVPLLFGLNLFRLEFHGPQGQARTETRTVNLGRALTPPGRVYYRVIAHERADGNARGHAELSAGLTRQMSVTARVAQLESKEGTHLYEGAGLRFGWDRLFAKTDAMLDSMRGSALQAAAATRLGRVGLWAQRAWLNDFRSEVFQPTFGSIRDRTGVRLDLEPRSADRLRLPTSLEWRHDGLAGGGVDEFIHQISVAARGAGFSNRLQWRFVRLAGASTALERRGTWLMSHRLRRTVLRGIVEYGFEHGGELRDVGLTAESAPYGQLLSAEIRRSVQSRETSARFSVTQGQGRLGAVLRTDYSSVSGGGVSLLLSFGFDRDPHSGRWHLDARPGSESGAVSAQVFLDDNGNGRRDPGEDPLEGVRLRATQASSEARTDADGVALLKGFPSGLQADLGLVTASLEDPLRVPRRQEVAILPRAGTTLAVDFPIVVCGEVAGTVFMRRDGVTRPQPGALLTLVTESGRVVKSARSAFDGYYDITAIPPGRYRLLAVPSGPARRDVAPATVAVVIGPDGPILEPVDLVLVGVSPPIADEDEP